MRDALRRHGSPTANVSFNITGLDHFDLIENGFLSRELKSLGGE
ncbi:hypothetical protein [Streptomyces sp. NPDC059861]